MTTHAFTIRPDIPTPPRAVAIPLANIRPSSQPEEPLRSLIESLTGTYDVFETRYWCKSWYELYEAGILAMSDVICLRGRTAHDGLLNLSGGAAPTITGGSFSDGVFTLDGVDDFIDTGINPTTGIGLHYTLNSAAIAARIPDDSTLPASGYLFGRSTSGTANVALRPKSNSLSTQSAMSLNNTTALTATYSGPWTGVWIGNRVDSDSIRLLRESALLASSDASTANSLPSGNIVIGKQSTTFAASKVDSLYVGGGLTSTQETDLTDIMNRHAARMAL